MRMVLMLGVLVFMCGCVAPSSQLTPKPADVSVPNIVVIFVDDLGYGDLGCFGQTGWKTPNIDRLAREGVRLTNFYVSQSVCSASRASMLTGCYANRVGIGGALGPKSKVGLDPGEMTFAEVAKGAGYATGAYGKWHLGDAGIMLPTRQGFDEWCGIGYSNDMWPDHPSLVKLPPEAEARKRGYPPLPLFENETIVNAAITAEDQAGFTRLFTERACAFIDRHAGRPLLVYVAHPMPHVPIFASREFRGRSGAGLYGDVIEELDWSVGQILETLERHRLRERTLVIFASDNGPWLSYGDHAGTTGGLREGKGTSWEGGVRVPFIASWPSGLPMGSVVHTPAMTIDVLPTIAALIERPVSRVDGVDLTRLLRDGVDGSLEERPLAFYYNANDFEALRKGKWKLVFPHEYRTLAGEPGRDGTPGPYKQRRTGLELYDLDADPKEMSNVADLHPAVVADLQLDAERFRSDLGDALTKRPGPGRRKVGTSP